jgi:hypothetical protein
MDRHGNAKTVDKQTEYENDKPERKATVGFRKHP